MRDKKHSLLEGLTRKNAVLSEGMVIAPIVVLCDTLPKGAMLSLAFSLLTFLAVAIGSYYPRKLPYAVRVILYALTAALLYIPVALFCEFISPDVYASLGTMYVPGIAEAASAAVMYLPLLAVNSFIVLHSELYFYRMQRGPMLISLLCHCLGFSLTACMIGFLREILAYGSVAGHVVDMPLVMHALATPWGGFILLGILCALHRVLFLKKEEA